MVTVYRLFDADDRLLYVGIASNFAQRVAQHIASKEWFPSVARATFEHHATRADASKREREIVKSEWPAFNVHRFDAVTLSASVPGEMARKVRMLARKRGVTASSLVTKALTMYLALADEGEERAA